jgi:fucose permease
MIKIFSYFDLAISKYCDIIISNPIGGYEMVHLMLAVIYLSFISLGLPDGLLGAAWPSMYPELNIPVSYAGIVSMIICGGTVTSSLLSDRLTHRFGAGLVTVVSVGMTAAALIGFSVCDTFWALCIWALPYGLGAGSVDASLNNYVALHYPSRHMSWLHCMWGVGAAAGPYMMGILLSGGQHWSRGYLFIGIAQILLSTVLFLSLPLWKKSEQNDRSEPLSLKQIMLIPGARQVMITFFCYCALEQTAALWSASYFHLHGGFTADEAASLGSLFFLGITLGRAISGFITIKLNDASMIRLGFIITAVGIVLLCIPGGHFSAIAGVLLVGLGCAPIYPCMMHATPDHFGAANSQALMGIQTASAYIGTAFMPPLFGLIANHISISLMGMYLLTMLVFMILSHRKLIQICKKSA